VTLPIFEMTVQTDLDKIRLTSLDFPHRYADAYLRDSYVGGKRFDDSPAGRRLRTATARDVRPLYEREPVSLILGAWDSHRKGRWPKFARLYAATMTGIDPVTGLRQGGRMCPVNLTGSINDSALAKDGQLWEFAAAKTGKKVEKGQRLSEGGHGNIPPNPVHGCVTVSSIHRIASISFAGLERLRFGDAKPEAAVLGRATLA